MAGSYNHAVANDGQLLRNKDFADMIENLGDAYEMAEEMYGMIWWLASDEMHADTPEELVQLARENYKTGLKRSPGVQGKL